MDDLDDAVRHLQDIAHIEDGGVAGVCFSDVTFNWTTADHAVRERAIRHWLRTERAYQ